MGVALGSVKKRINTPTSTMKAITEITKPAAVDTNTVEIWSDNAAGSAMPLPFADSSPNAFVIPNTVPTNPIIGGAITPITDTQMARNQKLRRRLNGSAASEAFGKLCGVS